jgi:hypothetical protein
MGEDGEVSTESPPSTAPEQVGVVWVDARRAVIARWGDDEPTLEHLESGVPQRHTAVGSVRRGPARPFGGGRVPGHGTEEAHERAHRAFLVTVAEKVEDLDEVHVLGRGRAHERLAELLARLASRQGADVTISTVPLSRRPSDRQLAARMRRLADAELPRRLVGRYRLPPQGPTTPTGRPLRPAGGRRTLRPARLPEHQEIEQELEAMLADDHLLE